MPPFWQTDIADALTALCATPHGLTAGEATARLRKEGPNAIDQHERRHLLIKLAHRLLNPLIAILLIAAAAAAVLGDPVSFIIILVVVILSTTLDLVQEHRAESTAQALRRSIALTASAVRDGLVHEVPSSEIVRGDVLRLAAGNLVPADGLLIEANHLQVNEALLTGEPFPVAKSTTAVRDASTPAEAANALFGGTSVLSGTGTLLVVATGQHTQLGAIAAGLNASPPMTAFERDIHRFGVLVVRLTVFLVAFVLFANLALQRDPLESFLFAMALAVGLTPELLPVVMTVALAHGASRMSDAKVVVKRMSAIHDLGQMDVLCTDKTGTLTEARIALVGHVGSDGESNDRVLELAKVNAEFETGIRSPLDDAILAHDSGPVTAGWTKLDERPFDFERRRISVLAERAGVRLEIVKGAPEAILRLCTRTGLPDAELARLNEESRSRLTDFQDQQASAGLRVLAIAWKATTDRTLAGDDDDTDLIFAGYCVFVDPPKASAASAIHRLSQAGVAIKIVSGDAAPVVTHLVASLGLSLRGPVTGDRIAALDEAALAVVVEENDLFARVAPDQKTRIVRALVDRGHTVGFLGDGINDAPAIRQADVGLSVDGATDVAREAADMILLAPDLEVLADGVVEGRRTYANIMKYVRMGTSSNFGNMVTMAIASLFLPFLPLTATQVLLNNLIYDVSEVGIPLDRVDGGELAQPRSWEMGPLLRFTMIMGLLSSLFDFATFFLLLHIFAEDAASFRAGWFLESMMTQILVVFVIRTTRPPWRDHPARLLTVSATLGAIAAIVVVLGPLRHLLGFGALPGTALAAIALLVCGYLIAAERLKGWAMRTTRQLHG